MSSSSVNDSGHSFGDDHNDAVLASHQDIKPSIKFLGADDNLSSSQDDYTIDKFISNNKDGLSPTECEIAGLFQGTNCKDVRSKPLTGEGDDIDDSYWLPSKPNYVSKVSLSPPSKDTTVVLSSSGERRIPFQQLNENRNQLSSSLSTTKPSSQQLDTSCDVDFNNTNQPPLSTQQIKAPPSQFKSDTRGESERIVLLSNIDIFEEYNVNDELVGIGKKLKGKLSPLLTLVRDRFDAMQDLGQYSSASGMLDAHNVCRDRRNTIFHNLRSADPEFSLYAQNGQPIRPEVHNASVLSFCTNDCVRNCLIRDGPETDNMTDLDNHCLVVQRNLLFYAALQDGGTEVSSPSLAAAFFDQKFDQFDCYQFSNSGNDYETMLKDLESLWKHEGGTLSLGDFTLAMHLDSVLNIMERANIHYVVYESPMRISHFSYRTHEKLLKGERVRTVSPNGIVEQNHFSHPQSVYPR